jgi:dihydroorotate dehydrogenase
MARLPRKAFDLFYDITKHPLYFLTRNDPETAHHLFIRFCDMVHENGLEHLLEVDMHTPRVDIAPAAGLIKNGDVSPRVLQALGFTRVTVGTVTAEYWEGNERPRMRRYVRSRSLANWMGHPSHGAETVAERLRNYGDHRVPLSITVSPTAGKKGEDAVQDIKECVLIMRDVPYVDRFTVNVSCPNTPSGEGGLDARREYQENQGGLVGVVRDTAYEWQEVYVKLSPDLNEEEVEASIAMGTEHGVVGYVTANTTTKHKKRYIPKSPQRDGRQVGGASGNAVWDDSIRVQELVQRYMPDGCKITAVGGINSVARAEERIEMGASEIQMLTGFVYGGPRLLRQLRQAL